MFSRKARLRPQRWSTLFLLGGGGGGGRGGGGEGWARAPPLDLGPSDPGTVERGRGEGRGAPHTLGIAWGGGGGGGGGLVQLTRENHISSLEAVRGNQPASLGTLGCD